MRILTTEMQYRVRQGAGAIGAAIVVTLGLCAAPAQAQDAAPALRAPLMQIAMLTGSMVPPSASMTPVTAMMTTTPISDADVAVSAGPATEQTAVQTPVDESAAVASSDDSNTNSSNDAGLSKVPLAAARIDDEQLGNQRGRNLQGGTMVKSPGMTLANGVTLWDELPGAVTPTPRPQQLSNGVNNVQVMRVTYTTR
ncbi:hypothetical protein [Pandoraea norimbergensis]|uniref:ESPR domain-containing protein n=1 Tax=Pandoraea norimbergensis TaxID=93219 RepID=A0ABN4JPD9_9BURK|nr:hypothetical protein [Pandoraea norimbergensis]ALS62411.1 hypothetical protein AT302_24095 [Pandoraea norimbergensis]